MTHKPLIALAFVAAMLVAGPAFAAAKAPASSAPPSAWVGEANNAFAADLYGKLASEEGNLFFSPNSIETALVMTYAGARGQTAEQMAKVLHLPKGGPTDDFDPAIVHQAFGALLKDLNAEKGADGKPRSFQLSVANALWGQKGFEFLPDFLKLVKDNYGAGLADVDFKADTEGARKTINAWVEKETRDKIKDLLQPGVLTPLTRLVLTNAIYFKGKWADPFEKAGTREEPFHLAGGKDVKAPLMNRQDVYGYKETADYQAVQLPYEGRELSMVVILPKKVDGLAAVEKTLTPDVLKKDFRGFGHEEVVVLLPKFKMTREFSLADTLSGMGMKDAFIPSAADLSGMDGKKDLVISAVVHKAFVDVSEEGTEAAAATAVVAAVTSVPVAPAPPKMFRADHPFLFLIRHEKSGAILFMGRLADPTK